MDRVAVPDIDALAAALEAEPTIRPYGVSTMADLAGALSSVDRFGPDLAAVLLGSVWPGSSAVDAGAALEVLQAVGWLRRLDDGVGRSAAGQAEWCWQPRPYLLVRAGFTTRCPELARRTQDLATDWYAEHGAPARALRHAVAAQAWPRVVGIVESHWSYLLFRQPGSLARALRSAPAQAVARSAIVLALREILSVAPVTPMPLPPLLNEFERNMVGRSPQARLALEVSLAAMVVCRRRGGLARAKAYSRQLHGIRHLAGARRSPDTAGLASIALVQSAIVSQLLGEDAAAIEQLQEAYRTAPTSALASCGKDAAARLALCYARLGLMPLASSWLARSGETPPARGLLARGIHGVTLLAEATIATAQLDRDRSERALGELATLLDDDESWPFVVAARTSYLLAWGRGGAAYLSVIRAHARELARRQAGASAAAAGTASAGVWPGERAGIAAPLLACAEAELLMALGRGNEAGEVLDGHDDPHPLLAESRARLALVTGDDRRARDLASAAVGLPAALSPLQRLEMTLIIAVASHRLAQPNDAAEALRRAVHQANLLAVLLPFARLPRADLLAIAADVPEALAILHGERLLPVTNEVVPAVRLVSLSARERMVLGKLSLGMTVAEIATTLSVSVNTVRTQRRGLYRKLGVTSRVQAVGVAADLGLIAGAETGVRRIGAAPARRTPSLA